ncbi:MAG: hypothetical protein AAGA71_18790 [Pseudomonadota bacterium]
MAGVDSDSGQTMISEEAQALMRRLVRPPKPRPPQAEGMSARRAWGMVVPRTAEETAGIVAAVHDVVLSEKMLSVLLEEWSDGILAVTLLGDGPSRGLAMFDAGLVAAMIEVQTTGHVLSSPPPERRHTDADAALTTPFVDAAMGEVDALLVEAGQRAGNWTCGRRVPTARAASLILDDGMFVETRIDLSLAEGATTGCIRVFVPDRRAIPGVTPADKPTVGDPRLAGRVEMLAILYRGKVPLEQIRTLTAGAELELPGAALDQIALETMEGKPLSPARLGRLGAHQAVRIGAPDATDPPAPLSAAAPVGIPPEMEGLRAQPLDPAPMAELAQLPDLPEPSALPDLPEPAALPDLPEPGALPDLPEPSALPDLPDLPPLTPEVD